METGSKCQRRVVTSLNWGRLSFISGGAVQLTMRSGATFDNPKYQYGGSRVAVWEWEPETVHFFTRGQIELCCFHRPKATEMKKQFYRVKQLADQRVGR